MEYRLILDDEEFLLGSIDPSQILHLTNAIQKSVVIDDRGDLWESPEHNQLYLNAYPVYFYLSLDKK